MAWARPACRALRHPAGLRLGDWPGAAVGIDGDEVSLYAEVASVGRTSLRIAVEAWRRARAGEETNQVTRAVFTFVAIDSDRRPRPVPEP